MFSDREQKIIDIIGRKTMTIEQIEEKLFPEKEMDGDIKISNCISRIIKKCEFHDLNWTLSKDKENRKLKVKKEKIA